MKNWINLMENKNPVYFPGFLNSRIFLLRPFFFFAAAILASYFLIDTLIATARIANAASIPIIK